MVHISALDALLSFGSCCSPPISALAARFSVSGETLLRLDSPEYVCYEPSREEGCGVKVYDFKVILEPDETGGYVVTCHSLAGCYSQGDTVEEALANIREAIELCLEDMREQGEQIPDPSGVLLGSVVVTQ
jgi:predicted RNase H-like HicB family nuclease